MNSTIENNGGNGIYITAGNNISSIKNIIRYNNATGMYLPSCVNCSLANNSIEGNIQFGITLGGGNIMINKNDIGGSLCGIVLVNSMKDILHNNSFHSCGVAFYPSTSLASMIGHIIDISNTVNGKPLIYRYNQSNVNATSFSGAGSIILVNCSRCTLNNLELSQETRGVQLYSSWNCTIANCTFKNYIDSGVYFNNSTLSTIKNCTFTNSGQSIFLQQNSNNDTITGNKITNGRAAIYLQGTMWDRLQKNEMMGCGLKIDGSLDAVGSHSIDQTNRVNGKVAYYYSGKQYLTKANFINAGQIFLVSCNYSTMAGCNLLNATWGLVLDASNYNQIMNINASLNSELGMHILDSSNNNITNCVIYENGGQGLAFEGTDASNNSVSNCAISHNKGEGINLFDVGQFNVLNGNIIQYNLYGIHSLPDFLGFSIEQNTYITNNFIAFNLHHGICLNATKYGHIIGNNISRNQGYGINIWGDPSIGPHSNEIYSNIITNNALGEACSNQENIWNNMTIGNCWGDYQEQNPNAITTNKLRETPFGLCIIWNASYVIGGKPGMADTLPFYQDPPLGLVATGASGQVAISWLAPAINGRSAITNYTIYRGTSPGGESLYMTLGNVTSYNDTMVAAGTTYYYTIRAVNGAGEGTRSTEVSATPTAVPLITPPFNLAFLILFLVMIIGLISAIAIITVKVMHPKKAIKAGRVVPTTPAIESPEVTIKDVLLSDAENMTRQINEKQAILARVLEPQTTSEINAAAQQFPLQKTDVLKVKKKTGETSSDDVIERKIDENMEQELKLELKEEHCIVCATVLKGTNYMCPTCRTKYCIRCAVALSQRNEVCWTCKEPLKF